MSKQRQQNQKEATFLIVVKSTLTFPNGTTETLGYHIEELPVSTNLEHYQQEYFEWKQEEHPEGQVSIEFLDIDDTPNDGSLPAGMTFRSARNFEAL